MLKFMLIALSTVVFSVSQSHADTTAESSASVLTKKLASVASATGELVQNTLSLRPPPGVQAAPQPAAYDSATFERMALAKQAQVNPKDIVPAEIKAKIRAKLERKLGDALRLHPVQMVVDHHEIKAAHTIDELTLRLQELLLRISYASHKTVAVEIAGSKFIVEKKPVGEGITGVVFQSVTESRVVKFPSPDVVGINAMLDEGFILPYADKLKEAGLYVAEPIEVHPLGIYAVKRAAPPLNVHQVLLRSGLVRVENGRAVRASTFEARRILKANSEVRDVASMVMKMISVRRSFDALNLDLGPANLHFEYDALGHERLVLVDTGRSGASTKTAIDAIRTFDDYLNFSESIINRYIDTGVMRTAPAARTCSLLFAPAA